MRKKLTIDPVNRVEGHLNIEVMVDQVDGTEQVVDAKVGGPMFRGFEIIMRGRDPRDAVHYSQRICGVCPVSHGMAASRALEQAFGIMPENNGRISRNLVLGANFIQSHVLHFYHLSAPDYLDTEGLLDMSPWKPRYQHRDLVTGDTAARFVDHYVQALQIRRKAHQMGSIFAGRLPGAANFVPGGSTQIVTADNINAFRSLLTEIRQFIDSIYLPDLNALADAFPAYKELGRGYGNLLSYGVFQLNNEGTERFLARGRHTNDASAQVLPEQIVEYVANSWYADENGNKNPSEGGTDPLPHKEGAYSWIKAPRYEDHPHEVGALSRLWVNGDYREGISVMHRLTARALESKKVADAMDGWLDELVPGDPVYQHSATPSQATGIGLTEAPRGSLGHWLAIDDEKLSHYQIITPTAWNASPKDDTDQFGPIEQGLMGTPVEDLQNPVEVLRVVHSFDPCLACSVHMLRPGKKKPVLSLKQFLPLLFLVLFAGFARGAVDIPMVSITEPGNPADITGFGQVDTAFRMGRYEVTCGEYAAFLNAVAASDTYRLLNSRMAITRSGTPGSFTYATETPDEPITHVNYYDAVRFINWLHNGQPEGAQDATTTEDGAYTLTGLAAVGERKPDARFFLPTENEWYKAAYYAGDGGYMEYPTHADEAPLAGSPGAEPNKANFDNTTGGVTPRGSYPGSSSFYGTFDQAGNVWEWQETLRDTDRGIRGGSWDDYALLLRRWYRDSQPPASELPFIGFRVAAVMPASVLFRRGDVNQDRNINLADAIFILTYLFADGDEPACLASADTNADGKNLDLGDAITLLSHLFAETGPLAAPFTACGEDMSPNALSCQAFNACP